MVYFLHDVLKFLHRNRAREIPGKTQIELESIRADHVITAAGCSGILDLKQVNLCFQSKNQDKCGSQLTGSHHVLTFSY